LIDQLSDPSGQRGLCDRIVGNQIMNISLEQIKERFWREIEIIKVGMIRKLMTPVAAVGGGQRIV